jgi:hypothetical protein
VVDLALQRDPAVLDGGVDVHVSEVRVRDEPLQRGAADLGVAAAVDVQDAHL